MPIGLRHQPPGRELILRVCVFDAGEMLDVISGWYQCDTAARARTVDSLPGRDKFASFPLHGITEAVSAWRRVSR